MAQEEEVPAVRVLPPARRPILPPEEGYVPPVRAANAGKRSAPGHTIAVNTQIYALLLHEKHALEVDERRLVSFGEVIQSLIDDRKKLHDLQDRIAAKRAAREAQRGEE